MSELLRRDCDVEVARARIHLLHDCRAAAQILASLLLIYVAPLMHVSCMHPTQTNTLQTPHRYVMNHLDVKPADDDGMLFMSECYVH